MKTRLLVIIGTLALASCTALQVQAGPYDGEYRQNQQPWPYYNDQDKRREQDERAGYPGSTDPRYDPDGSAKYRKQQEESYWQERQRREQHEETTRRQRQDSPR